MKIKHYAETGEAEICFSWREIWMLIKYQKLKLTQESLKVVGGSLLKIVMDWNAYFDDPIIKQLEQKDVVDPNAKRDK